MRTPDQPFEPSLRGQTLLRGHALVAEGAPVDAERRFVNRYHGTGGPGRALCQCGAMSDELPSAAARKRWHRQHKATVAA